jgi:hypothetical protein
MPRACLFAVLAVPLMHAAGDLVKPEGIGISTWVREDLFAGWIANDHVPFERGVQKLDRHLRDHPADPAALAWKYLVISYGMLQALARGDDVA